MNKIICDMCGTSYPENASQCPICGCTKPENPQILPDTGEGQDGTYTYVKGGRFSKSNVRKRNNMAKPAPAYIEDEPEEDDDIPSGSNRGLTIAIIVLLLAILAVGAYIYVRFLMPAKPEQPADTTPGTVQTTPAQDEGTTPAETPAPTPEETPAETTTAPETTPASVACTGISLEYKNVSFSAIGDSLVLTASVEPIDTTDAVTYTSSDPTIVSVDDSGKLTAVAEGSAVITVTCGEVSATCPVSVVLPTEPKTYKLKMQDVSITVGEAFTIELRDEDGVAVEGITWTTSKSGVASVNSKGKVTGVSAGTAYIRCTYEGVTYECIVRVS